VFLSAGIPQDTSIDRTSIERNARMITTTKRAMVVLALATAMLGIVLGDTPSVRAATPGRDGLIAFSRPTDGQTDIWTADPRTGDVVRLTRTPATNESMPDWNADGTKLAYSRCGLGEFTNCDIWIMNADGTGQQRLTRTALAQETWPAWSPDGTRIAFTSNAKDESQDIWVMKADGSNARRITTTIGFDAFPEWSPDGTKIAFTSARVAMDDIWIVNADGTHPLQITSGEQIDERPDWSPDGTVLVFSRDGDLWTVGVKGRALTQLTATDQWEFAPSFSPSGSRISFNRIEDDGRIGVWVMPADGARARQLTNGELDFFPDWQSD
jgi:TolB protein